MEEKSQNWLGFIALVVLLLLVITGGYWLWSQPIMQIDKQNAASEEAAYQVWINEGWVYKDPN